MNAGVKALPKLLSDPPVRQMIPPARIDDVAEAVLALTREVWVLTDRQIVMEQVMAAHGIDPGEIDAYVPDEAVKARLATARKHLLDTVLSALKAAP